jgi:hypothetical protein
MGWYIWCVYSRKFWFKALRRCGSRHVLPTSDDTEADWWLSSRKCIPHDQRKTFDSFVILGCVCFDGLEEKKRDGMEPSHILWYLIEMPLLALRMSVKESGINSS